HIGFDVFQTKVDLVEVVQDLYDDSVSGSYGPSDLGRVQIQVIKQVVKVLLRICSHRALLDVVEDGFQVFQDVVAFRFGVGVSLGRQGCKELLRFQEIPEGLE